MKTDFFLQSVLDNLNSIKDKSKFDKEAGMFLKKILPPNPKLIRQVEQALHEMSKNSLIDAKRYQDFKTHLKNQWYKSSKNNKLNQKDLSLIAKEYFPNFTPAQQKNILTTNPQIKSLIATTAIKEYDEHGLYQILQELRKKQNYINPDRASAYIKKLEQILKKNLSVSNCQKVNGFFENYLKYYSKTDMIISAQDYLIAKSQKGILEDHWQCMTSESVDYLLKQKHYNINRNYLIINYIDKTFYYSIPFKYLSAPTEVKQKELLSAIVFYVFEKDVFEKEELSPQVFLQNVETAIKQCVYMLKDTKFGEQLQDNSYLWTLVSKISIDDIINSAKKHHYRENDFEEDTLTLTKQLLDSLSTKKLISNTVTATSPKKEQKVHKI